MRGKKEGQVLNLAEKDSKSEWVIREWLRDGHKFIRNSRKDAEI